MNSKTTITIKMRETVYSAFIIIATVYMLGCNQSANSESQNEGVLTINIDTIPETSESFDIDKIQYIPLETSDNSIIGSIDKVLFINNLFYISDFWDSKALFIFSEEGQFIKKINSSGRGPGEYLQPIDFDIDPHGNVRILDNGLKKVLTFSSHGEYISEEKLDIRFTEFFWTSDNQFMFNYQYDTQEEGVCLGLYSLSNKSIETLIPSRGIRDDISIKRLSTHYFFRSNNTVLFNPRFSNKCYQLSSKENLEERILLVSKKFPNEEFISKFKANPQVGDLFPNNILDITNIYETSEFLYLRIGYGRYMRQNILYSKSSENFINYQRIDKESYLGDENIHGVSKDFFISILPSSKANDSNWKENVDGLLIDDHTKSLLRDLSIESNPVIVLFNFKTFEEAKN